MNVISADSSRKYKSRWAFSAHAQTKGGYLVLGRTDGAVALYDYIMQSENASCVIDSHKVGAVTSVDVAADGTMIVWTTAEFVFFTCGNAGHWAKGTNEPKLVVLRLRTGDAPINPPDLRQNQGYFFLGRAGVNTAFW